jgi:LAO/AO transport system kinase
MAGARDGRGPAPDPESLLDAARDGDRASLARLLSLVERGGDGARAVARVVFPLSGGAHTVGITGAPGAGKSSLTNALCSVVRAAGEQVAVLAIDPSSPFSGGAILGDRVRMGEHTLDAGVYIRSMATRGHLGGLSLATPEAARVLDAAGYRWVVIETVGVGQVEVEVAGAADTTVVVVNPGWGDAVQANKAGLLEIADVFVINKADRAGAAETRRDLESMLALGAHRDRTPPILETVATTGAGVAELWAAVAAHRAHLVDSGELERRRTSRAQDELREVVAARLLERAAELCAGDPWDRARARVASRESDPWAAADDLLSGGADGPAAAERSR